MVSHRSTPRLGRRIAAAAALLTLLAPVLVAAPSAPAAAQTVAATADGEGVTRLYLTVLGRVPDPAGLAHWQRALARGAGPRDLATALIRSPEFRSSHPRLDAAGFIDLLYQRAFGRSADPAGRAYWLSRIERGVSWADVAVAFANAPEASRLTGLAVAELQAEVHRLYLAAFRRHAEPAGLLHWVQARRQGVSLHTIASVVVASPEFRARYGVPDDGAFVDLLYTTVIERPADAAGRAYWIAQVARHGRASVLIGFSQSAEFRQRSVVPEPMAVPTSVGRPPTSAPAPAPSSSPAAAPAAGRVLVAVDFDRAPARAFGAVTRADMAALFGLPTSCSAVGELALSEGTLRVRFRPNHQGSARAFCTVTLPSGHDELWLQYRVLPEHGWVPVKGGKLAGLAGGAANTGGNAPRSGEGFSARNMWRSGGSLVQYTYHQGQPGRFGEDFAYRADGRSVDLVPGRWHTITHRVRLNSPGRSDGSIAAWVDGRPVLDRTGLVLRGPGQTFSIDRLMVGGFYGGNDHSWAPPHTTYIRFDDVVVSTGRPS